MIRSYRHIQMYEKEIFELRAKGKTNREIGEKLELSKEQIHDFLKRYRRKERKVKAGETMHKKGICLLHL